MTELPRAAPLKPFTLLFGTPLGVAPVGAIGAVDQPSVPGTPRDARADSTRLTRLARETTDDD